MRHQGRDLAVRIIMQAVIIIFVITAIFPIYFLIINSFKSEQEYIQLNKFGFPRKITLESFLIGFKDGKFAIWFLNSILMTAGSVLLSTFFSCFAAYAFSRLTFAGRNILFNITISLLMIPVVIIITPLFVFMAKIRAINSRFATILIYSGILMPFAIYLLNNFFVTIPQSILDSAIIEGCSDVQILWRIIAPISRPAIITLIIVNSLYVWNELLIALVFLQGNTLKTLMAGISTFTGLYNVNIPVIMAGIFISTIPMVIIYIIGQKQFIQGLLDGSLAGQ
jgi:ABC-type glycerol-3-phosphate transport system permease component